MISRNTYHATVVGFKTDIETNDDLICLSNVIDSDGDLVAMNLDLFAGAWTSGLEVGKNVSFSAKMKSRIKQHNFDGKLYNVRECVLVKPKIE